MKRKHTLRSLLSMVCTIAMIISMVPVLPAAAAEGDLLFDNMESYTVGTDVYTQAPDKYTQKSPSWNAVKDVGGSAIVVADPTNSKNKVIAVSTPGGDSTRYVFSTAPELNGDYTVQFDYMPGNAEGNPNSGFMDVYVNSGNAHMARIASGLYNTYFNLDKTGCSNVITNAELDMKNQWYSVRIVVTAGQYVMEIWEKGDEDTKLTATTTKGTKAVSKAHVEFCIGPYLESQKVGDTSKPITNYIDNIRITPGVVEAEDPSEAGTGTTAVSGGGMIEFVDEYIIENKDAVAVTAGMGIFSGKDGNRFDPQGQLTRAEMATVIVKMLRGNAFNADNFKGVKTFNDTADYQGGWAEGYINACVQLGIVSGYGDGTFKPGNPVTTAEAVTMIINALKVDAGEGSWPTTVMAKAEEMKLYGELKNKPATYDALTRDQLAVLVYEGMCYSPAGVTGFIVDGMSSEIVFTSFSDALKVAENDLTKIHEVMGEDTLASKVYDMKIAEGFVYTNQESSSDLYTTIISLDDGNEGFTEFNMNTTLDKVGHYVTVYYRETWNGINDPGVVYNYVDKTETIAVAKDIASSKDYKEVFYEKYTAADEVAIFDGCYNFVDYASIDDIYTAGSKAEAGTYFVYESEIVGYMAPAATYAAQVETINDFDGNETIRLSGVAEDIENNENKDCIREYKGIKEEDYVIYTKVGSGDDTIYVLTQAVEAKGMVSKKTTNKDGDSVVTINGVEYVQFAGSNENEYNHIDKFNDGDRTTAFEGDWVSTYALYITEEGKYFGFEKSEGAMNISQTVFVLGEAVLDTTDSYGKSIRKTYARGVDMSGNEVMLLVNVQKNGEVDEGLFFPSANEDDNICDPDYSTLAANTFYTYELSKDSAAKKEEVYKLKAYPTAYDEDTAPIYAGSNHVAANGTVGFNGYKLYNNMLTYASSGVIYMTLECELDENGLLVNQNQTDPLAGKVQKLPSTSANTTGSKMYRYFLFSRGADGNQLIEAAVIVSGGLNAGNTTVYVSEASLESKGASTDGITYTVYDYKTASKKEITLATSSDLFTSTGFWHLTSEADSSAYTVVGKVVDSGKFDYNAKQSASNDNLYNENILHDQVMISLINDQLSTAYASAPAEEIMTRAQKASAGAVIDTRSEEQIKSDGVGKITSLSRIQNLMKTNPEITVVFDVCFVISGGKVGVIYVKDVKFTSTEETTVTESNGTYRVDGRTVADDVEITDVSGRLEGEIDMDALIAKMEESTVTFEYEVDNGKVVAITVTGVLEDGELFFAGFDGYEDGEDYTDSVVEGTSAAKYTSVTTETIGEVKALQVTSNTTGDASALYAGPSVTGNYVWETRVKMVNTANYTKLYTTGLKTRKATTNDFGNFQLHVQSGAVNMYRGSGAGGSTTVASGINNDQWLTIRVTVTNIVGSTANDAIKIEVIGENGSVLGTLEQSGDYVSVETSSRIGFDVRGTTIAIDYIKVAEGPAQDEADTFEVTAPNAANGLIALDKTAAAEGETVTVTTTAKTGYKLSSLTVNGEEQLDEISLDREVTTTFTMPGEDAEIIATFEPIRYAKVTVTNPDGATITVTGADDLDEVIEGTVLTITAEVEDEDSYALKGIYVNGEELEGDTYTVTGEDVEITAEIDVMYEIFIYEPIYGTVTATVNGTPVDGAAEGATVTITCTPDPYCELRYVKVTDDRMSGNSLLELTEVSEGVYTFEMPACEVYVDNSFAQIKYNVSTGTCLDGTVSLSKTGEVAGGTTITVTGTNMTTGFELKTVYVNGEAIEGTSFTLKEDSVVTALFWPVGAVYYDNFDAYDVGSFDYTKANLKVNNVKGNAEFKIANVDGEKVLYVGATGATGTTRSRLNVGGNYSGSYMVETRMKTNDKGTLTLIHMNNVKFAKTGGTTPLDLRFGNSGQVHLEVNPKTADNTLTGTQEDTKNQLYLYTGGTAGKVASGTSTKGANGFVPGTWYTIRIYVNDSNKEVTVELWNSNATTKLASRILYAASLAATPLSFECQSVAGETNEAWWDYFVVKTWNP